MEQLSLFSESTVEENGLTNLGAGLSLEIIEGHEKRVKLYSHGVLIKTVNLSDKVAKKLFVIEVIDLGGIQSRLSEALLISRQTIHNYLEIRKYFGLEGLIQGYTLSDSKSRSKQRELHREERIAGNKAKIVAGKRRKEREELEKSQLSFNFTFGSEEEKRVEMEEQPFSEEHDWEETRYAGRFIYLIPMITQWKWLCLVMGYFGKWYKIFMIFLLMAAANIRSIEQLKNVRSREAGIVLGIRRIPSKPKIWGWFYNASRCQVSRYLHTDYFRYQIRAGIVGIWLWFTDGHLLPYTGKERVRCAYNTQRRMPEPGRTSMVTCDESGRVVDFEIQEGKGDLRAHITTLACKWEADVPRRPVMVFDREGDGAGFFSGLVSEEIPFVTWEKHADSKKLSALEDKKFTEEFEFNGKNYSVFEGEKTVRYIPEEAGGEEHVFKLRRIFIWNKTSKRRTSGLAWTGENEMSTADCARAILSRWGASENTFKHLKDRHPLHYHPGFKLVKSDQQMIANPEIKEKERITNKIKKGLNKIYRQLTKAKKVLNKDGSPRQNSVKERLKKTILYQEAKLETIKKEKRQLPEKVDVSTLEDYKSFKRIDNEGKYLFDFVTTSVWNARKQLVDWLRPFFNEENELVDLFYAITDCHGRIRSTKTEVVVRLEPLQQPKRRIAQEQLCRKLTSLGARTPLGKRMIIEVDGALT
jgi:hypothetical protein